MSLPTLHVPIEMIKLYTLPKPVKIRPYLVGEEKLLLMAQQAKEQNKDTKEIEKAVRQLIERCSFGVIDMDTLPIFDVTYLFLQLRSMSLNNIITTQFRCKNQVALDGKSHTPTPDARVLHDCDTLVPISINIADIKLTVPEGHTNKVMLEDTLGITLKYPTARLYDTAQKTADLASVIGACLATIFRLSDHEHQDPQVWEIDGQSPGEVEAFVNSLTLAHVQEIRTKFFDSMPRLTHTFTFLCPKCGYTEEVVLQELEDFFD
jgi:hypothetical protein